MFQLSNPTQLTSTLAALALVATGCAMDQADDWSDTEAIAAALEQENGGLDMEDEAPLFGDELLFADAEVDDQTTIPVDDPMAEDSEVAAMEDAPDAVVYHATVMWGQIPADLDNPTPYNWSGSISVNRGAIIVRSVIGFEGRVDRIAPRETPQTVAFTSATLPHRDGLRLTLIDPEPGAAEALTLTYTSADGDVFTAGIAALLEGPQSRTMDDAGNRVVAVAMAQPIDVCRHGFLGGRWHKVADGRGRIVGRVVNAAGEVVGHIRGLYGVRQDGERVFFAKYIGRAGGFRGILRGTYGEGSYRGRWIARDGDVGGLAGEYRENAPGQRVGGHFLGRWAETTCNLDIAR